MHVVPKPIKKYRPSLTALVLYQLFGFIPKKNHVKFVEYLYNEVREQKNREWCASLRNNY